MSDNYKILIKRLDEFIRKYYTNQLLKGGLYFIAVSLVFYLILNTLEYFGNFGISVRTILFYAYLLTNIAILIKLVFIPLLKLNKYGKIISHEDAAKIIGKHFPEVQDRLLNTLQLKKISEESRENLELLEAGINQKIIKLKPVPFKLAIDLKENRRYLKYALPPILLIVIILFSAPSFITEPTKRIIAHNVYFEPKAPFRIIIQNENLEAMQQDDYLLKVKIVGDEIPDKVFIEYNDTKFIFNKESNIEYNYEFKNIQNSVKFKVVADRYRTKEYELIVLPKPIILDFHVELIYPDYIRKKTENLINTGDLIVPNGTLIKWKFFTRQTESLTLRFNDEGSATEQSAHDVFVYDKRMFKSQDYTIIPENTHITESDSLRYSINVIPDTYPTIIIEEFQDSVFDKRLYFKGLIKDDYGFSNLKFVYNRYNENSIDKESNASEKQEIAIDRNNIMQQFFHYFDLASLNIGVGDEVEYYFVVSDNDGINGPKATKSQKMVFKAPTEEEIEENTESANKKLKNKIESTIKDAEQLQKNIEKLNRELLEKENISWQEKSKIEDLLQQHEELKSKVEEIQLENEMNNLKEQEYNELSDDILEKQRLLKELFDEIMDEEMRDMFDELEKMLEDIDKDKVNEMLDKIEMNSEDLEKQLDRNLELFKQLEFEKKLEETIEKLDKLAEEQKKLSEETEQKQTDKEELLKKQEEIQKEFDDIKEDLDDLKEKNNQLEEKHNLGDADDKEKEIDQNIEDSKESIIKNRNKKASQQQKDASENMQKLSDQLNSMMSEQEMQQLGDDINTLRDILENLILVSFDQEELMSEISDVNTSDPKYVKLIEEQKFLKDDLDVIEDSLFALAKRQSRIKPFVTREISDINHNVEKAIESLNDRRIRVASGKQQMVMTSVNNLALMLTESMDQMKQQMQNQQNSEGNSSCSKPGGGKPSPSKMRQLQDQLNQQMEQMKKNMNGRNKPDGKKGMGKQSMSEQFARMAAQQEAIRREMQKYAEQIKGEGTENNAGINKMLKDMEQTETDLVNKIISQQTLKRQEEILTRLLESEKADREREKEKKRESNEAKNYKISNPNENFEYKSIKSKEVELLKTLPPNLMPFYRQKVNDYFYYFEN
jgi:hypothetical protein